MKGFSILGSFCAYLTVTVLLTAPPHTNAGSLCGNLTIDPNEQCDDGNLQSGDGCSEFCMIEDGFQCTLPFFPLAGGNIIQDSGFEQGLNNNFWEDISDVQPNICNLDKCPQGAGPRYGAHWLQIGGTPDANYQVVQTLFNNPDTRYLRFDVQAQSCAEPQAPDLVEIYIENTQVWAFNTSSNLCTEANGAYSSITIDLAQFPEWPLFQDTITLFIIGLSGTGETVVAFDNFELDKLGDDPIPSVCTLNSNVQVFQPFENIAGPLEQPAFFQELIGEVDLPWGTTDDGLCGTGIAPPGNLTGGPGEAACIDSTILEPSSGQLVESYFCLAPLDLSNLLENELSFLVNYQPGQNSEFDFFGVWVGVEPFLGPFQDGIDIAQFITNKPIGTFGEPPGDLISLDISQFDDQPEVFVCFGYGNEGDGYVQTDTLLLTSGNCIDDFEEDKLMSCIDNCTDVPNPLQIDSDNDGYGNACDADIARNVAITRSEAANGNDCVVNFLDLATFSDAIFSVAENPNWNPDADFNTDGVINFLDLAIFANSFLNAPGPSAFVTRCGGAP